MDSLGSIDYYYIDAPQNSTTIQANVTLTANATYAHLYYMREGYPLLSRASYHEIGIFDGIATLYFSWHSLYPGGRIYIGVQNADMSATLNYTMSISSNAISTTGSNNCGTTTSGTSTGTSTSTTGSTVSSTTESPDSGVAEMTYSAIVLFAFLVMSL